MWSESTLKGLSFVGLGLVVVAERRSLVELRCSIGDAALCLRGDLASWYGTARDFLLGDVGQSLVGRMLEDLSFFGESATLSVLMIGMCENDTLFRSFRCFAVSQSGYGRDYKRQSWKRGW